MVQRTLGAYANIREGTFSRAQRLTYKKEIRKKESFGEGGEFGAQKRPLARFAGVRAFFRQPRKNSAPASLGQR